MKATTILPIVLAPAAANAAAASAPAPDRRYLFANPAASSSADASAYKIPTSYESAVMGRRILALTPLATFSTIFPSSPDDQGGGTHHSLPSGVAGSPVGLNDYIADCEEEGNPTILSLRIGTSFQNVRHGSNISVSLAWVPPYPPARRIRSVPVPAASSSYPSLFSSYIPSLLRPLLGLGGGGEEGGEQARDNDDDDDKRRPDPAPYSAANLPRFSLLGYLEKVEPSRGVSTAACYVAAHPDAKYWLPGNPIHEAEWVRLVVTRVYWIGGFGDRAYIGWIPVEEWRAVRRAEWEAIRLPGEKPGWKEWSVEAAEFADL